MEWIVYGPAIIIVLAAIFLAAATNYGLYTKGPPGWIISLIWAIMFGVLAVVWCMLNYTIPSDEIIALNYLMVVHLVFVLAWVLLTYGDGRNLLALIAIMVAIFTALPLFWFARSEWWMLILISIYMIWLFYVFYLSIVYMQAAPIECTVRC